MLNFDLYREPFNLVLPDGKTQYRTLLGSILSIITIVVVMSYGSIKMASMVNYSDYKVQVRE